MMFYFDTHLDDENCPRRRAQAGNVLLYVLLAVALLAALSFAVSQGGRSGMQDISREKARLLATALIDYSGHMAGAVSAIRLRGVAANSLCFDTTEWPAGAADEYDHAGCADEENQVFSVNGGGMQWQDVSSDSMSKNFIAANRWRINGKTVIDDVGSAGNAAENAELLLYVSGLQESVCHQINVLLGIAAEQDDLPQAAAPNTDPFDGVFAYGTTIGAGSAISGKKAACYRETGTGDAIFYRVLLAR